MKEFLNAFGPVAGGMRVAGFELVPVGLGHVVMLEAAGNRIVAGGELRPEDVVQAAACLSAKGRMACGEAMMGEDMADARRMAVIDLAEDEPKLRTAAEALGKWWDAWFVVPPVMPGPQKSGAQSPWQVRAVVRAMRAGLTAGEAWWNPAGEVLWVGLASAEIEGAKVTLRTEEVEEGLRKLGWGESES